MKRTNKTRLPKGYPNPYQPGYTRISVSLKNATFQKLLKLAKAEKKTFSETVEFVLSCGILCLKESDAQELPKILEDA